MSRKARAALWGVAFVVGVGMGAFLVSQGLSRADLWATVVGLPVAIVGTAAGVWSTVLAARAVRETREVNRRAEQEQPVPSSDAMLPKAAHVEIVDASVDSKVEASLADMQLHTGLGFGIEYQIPNVMCRYGAIDFKFINSGDVPAVLHRFTVEVLDFQLDAKPVLT